jgi:hypothetical protein
MHTTTRANEWGIGGVRNDPKIGAAEGWTMLEDVQDAIQWTSQLGRVQGSKAFPTHEFLGHKFVHNDRSDGII